MTTCKSHKDSPGPQCQLCSRALALFWAERFGMEKLSVKEPEERDYWADWGSNKDIWDYELVNYIISPSGMVKATMWAKDQGYHKMVNREMVWFQKRILDDQELEAFRFADYGDEEVVPTLRAAAEVPEKNNG